MIVAHPPESRKAGARPAFLMRTPRMIDSLGV
jgi:hypothetical protein